MISINRIGSALQGFFENVAKARVNSVLLGMDAEKLAQVGISRAALERGPSAWPWRETTQDSAANQSVSLKAEAIVHETASPNAALTANERKAA